MRNKKYDKITLYGKILRKEKFCEASSFRINSIATQLTDAYLIAAKYYLNQAGPYLKPSILDFEQAMAGYQKAIKLDKNYRQIFNAVSIPIDKRWEKLSEIIKEAKLEACLAFGEQFVQQKDWQAAKIFYTKKILKYLNPAEGLEALGRFYNTDEKAEIKQKIWGKDIFVVLEDFEDSSKPVFINWAGHPSIKVKAHKISKQVSRTENCSEFFDLYYFKGGWNYWAKDVYIPLSETALPMGVRVFVKSQKPFKGCLKLSIHHEKEGKDGIYQNDIKKDVGDGWQMRWVDNLFKEAKISSQMDKCSIDNISINAIIISPESDSNQFYVDDIELYLI